MSFAAITDRPVVSALRPGTSAVCSRTFSSASSTIRVASFVPTTLGVSVASRSIVAFKLEETTTGGDLSTDSLVPCGIETGTRTTETGCVGLSSSELEEVRAIQLVRGLGKSKDQTDTFTSRDDLGEVAPDRGLLVDGDI